MYFKSKFVSEDYLISDKALVEKKFYSIQSMFFSSDEKRLVKNTSE
jgi:hypothetical protein